MDGFYSSLVARFYRGILRLLLERLRTGYALAKELEGRLRWRPSPQLPRRARSGRTTRGKSPRWSSQKRVSHCQPSCSSSQKHPAFFGVLAPVCAGCGFRKNFGPSGFSCAGQCGIRTVDTRRALGTRPRKPQWTISAGFSWGFPASS